MKTKKFQMFCLALVTGMFLFLGSCDDDDESSKTFLEKNDGKSWFGDEVGVFIYLRLNNDTNNILDIWYPRENCYYYEEDRFEGGTIKIIENSSDKLIMGIEHPDITETYTFSLQGDQLKLFAKSFYEGDTYELTLYFDSSTVNVDDLNICDDF